LLCAGVGTLLALQVFCNAGVATGILPVTGMPLPFMSYGGSGLMCMLIGIGLVLGVSRGISRNAQNEAKLTASETDDDTPHRGSLESTTENDATRDHSSSPRRTRSPRTRSPRPHNAPA
ncbi:MAG TPA: FtsW/RodA/SpoVE family cell cycle protein, partial [Abditibacteriaceae bacterium]